MGNNKNKNCSQNKSHLFLRVHFFNTKFFFMKKEKQKTIYKYFVRKNLMVTFVCIASWVAYD